MRDRYKVLLSSKGMTLLEVLLSIVILSIILVSFVTMFVQSARTNQYSSKIIDATFVAQTYMEKIYEISNNHSYDEGITKLNDEFNHSIQLDTGREFTKEEDQVYITANISDPQNGISSVVVKVYKDSTKSRLEAQMETRIEWKKEEDV